MGSKQIFILVLATALLSAGISASISSLFRSKPDSNTQVQILNRIEQLESKLSKEQKARLAMGNSLPASSSLAQSNLQPEDTLLIDSADQEFNAKPVSTNSFQELERQEVPTANPIQSRADLKKTALINTGLSEDEAAYILTSESAITLEQLNSRYENQREEFERSDPQNRSTLAQTNPLRAKLGDEYYQNYLKANGFPTSARVSSVIESSPGYNAGLQAGDHITAYAGQRVFNLNDLASLTYRGNPGESVLLEIERDGEALQLTIPRGPIGASSARNRFRR